MRVGDMLSAFLMGAFLGCAGTVLLVAALLPREVDRANILCGEVLHGRVVETGGDYLCIKAGRVVEWDR